MQLTPLYLAARYGHAECVKVLLKRGAIVDTKSSENATPLYVAVREFTFYLFIYLFIIIYYYLLLLLIDIALLRDDAQKKMALVRVG